MSSIRDENGKWLDSSIFRKEALHFMKNGYYCPDPVGSPSYINYWQEQLKRCKEGYEVDGVKITGHHYFYLNFTEIEVAEAKGAKVAKKVRKMPDFWDGDYDFFWSLEIAKNGLYTDDTLVPSTLEERETFFKYQNQLDELIEYYGKDADKKQEFIEIKEKRDKISKKVLDRLKLRVTPDYDWLDGGHHLIVGKSRRKGYSYKNAAICANIYNTERNSLTLIGAFDKKYLYPEGTMGMVSFYLSFLNKHTAWKKSREFVDKQEHKKASFKEVIDGIPMESGYRSQVMAISFGDNPDAARGKDAKVILFEEAGKFPNLKDSYNATEPGLTAGKYITGQMVIFGTGGDMESGTVDFAEMFYHPKQFNLMPFVNIWDEDANNSYCGFFHAATWNMEGHYDEQGNSDVLGAEKEEKKTRDKIIKNSTSTTIIQKRVQEYPLNPSEAFLTVSVNDFPIVELRNHLNKVQREELYIKKGQPCYLYKDNESGKIIARPDLENKLQPLWDYNPKTTNLDGAVVIYEYPMTNAPKGLYKIGFDPYRQAQSASSSQPSLAAIYVYKAHHKFTYTRNQIVASYIGRPYDPDTVNRICEMLCELYNAEVMHENEVTHVKGYFEKRKKLNLLAAQPDAVISKAVNNSKVARIYGIHMNDKIKDAGEKYIKAWLLEERDVDENGSMILNLETIYDPGLLEELIKYNRKGNFDRCVVKGSKITTLQEVKNIEDIEVEDLVLNSEGVYDKVERTDKSFFKGNLVELNITGQADTLIVTDNHPILIASTSTTKHNTRIKSLNNLKYKRADSLKDKYQFCLLPKRQNLLSNIYSDDILYLIGWCLGDGYVDSKRNRISICLQYNQENIADKLSNIIDNYTKEEENKTKDFIKKGKEVKGKRIFKSFPTQKIKKEGYIKIVKTSKKLTELLLKVGCIPNNKKISTELYHSSNLMPLVIGLLEADGHQKFNHIGKSKRCNIEISSIYKNLILQLRQILIDNGIWSSISNVVKRNQKPQIRLNISTNYVDKILSYYPSLKFRKCNLYLRKEIQLQTEIGFWTPIKIINNTPYEGDVYNIAVEGNHTYLANGIVNHNCMAFMMLMFQIEEDGEHKDYAESQKNKNAEDISNLLYKMYKKSS